RCHTRVGAGSRVRIIPTPTLFFHHIDTAWCATRGIRVATAAGCNARGVLQWVAAVLAHLARREGWHPSEKTLGIVGVGHVGSLVKAYAESWGFRVVCCDPPREAQEHCGFLPLHEVARRADLLTFHVPLDDTTRHMADAALLATLKPGATLLNSSRGEVVDGHALLACGRACALDVWEQEPCLDPALLARATLATPHIAGYSEQGKATASAMAVAAVSRVLQLPVADWYPPQAAPPAPRPISWPELCTTIDRAFDIAVQSDLLKAHPADFERMRDEYAYRREYF
ncbi:MAG: 4-phosphoerythronate dehydrogenase, partial [Alistipes sp.]|nr:4-phosphoerythronate dehydrogenase [Alistipes sp.]